MSDINNVSKETLTELQQSGILVRYSDVRGPEVKHNYEITSTGKEILKNGMIIIDAWVDSTIMPDEMWKRIRQVPRVFWPENLIKRFPCEICKVEKGQPCKDIENGEVHRYRLEMAIKTLDEALGFNPNEPEPKPFYEF